MYRALLIACLVLSAIGCGGGAPEAEATWETHTVAVDEDSSEPDSSEPDSSEPDSEGTAGGDAES